MGNGRWAWVAVWALAACQGEAVPAAVASDAPTVDAGDAVEARDAADARAAPDAEVGDGGDAAASVDVREDPDGSVPRDVPAAPVDASMVPVGTTLFTLDRRRFDVRDVGGAIDHALAASGADNVIVYVHGRGCGGEPEKSLSEAMPALARDYSAAPVLFFWPGSDESCPLGFPEARARAAGAGLAIVLGDVARYRRAHPAATTRFTLLTHSMGSLVLEAATAVTGVAELPRDVFDTAVINAGASAATDHAAWLARVRFSPSVFVTVNSRDLVLTAAGLGRSTRLGRSVTDARLAAGFTYADFSSNGVNHAYYVASGQSGAAMIAFYRSVMNGEGFDFAGSAGVGSHERRDGAVVEHFNGR